MVFYAQVIVSRRQLLLSMMHNAQRSEVGKTPRLLSPIIGSCMFSLLYVRCMQEDQARLAFRRRLILERT